MAQRLYGSALSPAPIRLMLGGLESVVQDGFQLLGAGSMEERRVIRTEAWMRPVSAEKLVYGVYKSVNVCRNVTSYRVVDFSRQ